MWDNFVYCLAAGICLGAIYSLIALGYTLVYGIIKLINFAHGEFCMAGAYAGLGLYLLLSDPRWAGFRAALHLGEHTPPLVAIPAILIASGLAGAAIAGLTERIAYRPIRNAGRLSALLTAIGMSLLLQNLGTFIDNGQPQTFAGWLGDWAQRPIRVGSGGIKAIELAYVPAAIVLTAALWYVVQSTRFGRAMRAVSQDLDAAKLMGVETDAVIARTFLIGGFLAGVAGTLRGVTAVVEPTMGFLPGLNAFVAAVVGGIGSIGGAMLGGFLIGIVQYLVVWAGVPTGYKDVASFAVLIIVLVLRPQGILGKREAVKV